MTKPFLDLAGNPVPAPPAYGHNSLADVFESAASLVAQRSLPRAEHPLDGKPGFSGSEDPLQLAHRLTEAGADPNTFRNICVIMVDGLGEELLNTYSSYAPYLKNTVSLGPLDAAFPTTTAASLATLGTASAPGAHGIAGYEVRNPATNTVMNHLSGWDQSVDPHAWQPLPTVFERYAADRRVVTISLGKYRGSGLTEAALRGGEFVEASGFNARITYACELLASRTPTLVYLYWGEIDQAGHKYGAGSREWLEQLEELNLALRRLSAKSPAWAGIFLTADHGMVNVPREQRIDYSQTPELLENVALTAGEPRAVQLYLHDKSPQARQQTAQQWAAHWGENAWILDAQDLYERGYYGPVVHAAAWERIGDLIVCAREDYALYDMRRQKEQALAMVGQHGSMTDAERLVPLRYLPTS